MVSRVLAPAIFLTLLAGCGKTNTTAPKPQAAVEQKSPPATAPTPSNFDASLAPSASVKFSPHLLGKGTNIPVKLLSVADSSVTQEGFLPGQVTSDVKGADGTLAIPANSPAVIIVRESKKTGAISRMVLGLYSVRIGESEHALSDGAKEPATVTVTEDAGKGTSHSAVHLQFGAPLDFQLQTPVQLR